VSTWASSVAARRTNETHNLTSFCNGGPGSNVDSAHRVCPVVAGRLRSRRGGMGIDVLLQDVLPRLANSGYAARGRGVASAVAGELEELPAFSAEQLGGAPMVPPGLP
jgi:hypothetical protein